MEVAAALPITTPEMKVTAAFHLTEAAPTTEVVQQPFRSTVVPKSFMTAAPKSDIQPGAGRPSGRPAIKHLNLVVLF
jgi:hypothetical protein